MAQALTFAIPNVTVATAAVLTALTGLAVLADGARAHIASYDDDFELVTQSGGLPALVPDVVLASSTAGRVYQRLGIAKQRWGQSITWFMDGTGGSDEADGQTNVTPLKTGAELARRMARQAVGGGGVVVITMVGNIADDFDFSGVEGVISIVGVQTVVTSGTLNASTAINRAGNTFQTVGTVAFDFTPHVNRKVKLTSGSVAEAWVDSIPGANQARTSPFTTQAGGPLSGAVAVVTPAGNETFDIVTESTFRQIIMDDEASSFSPLVVALTRVAPTAQTDGFRTGFVLANRINLPANTRICGSCFAFVLACQTDTFLFAETGGAFLPAIHALGNFIATPEKTALMQFAQDAMVSDKTIFPNNSALQLNAVGFLNTSPGRHAVDCRAAPFAPGSSIQIDTAIYGSLTGIGSIGFQTDRYTQIFARNTVPTMTTNLADVNFGSAAKTWAQLPFVDQFNVGAGPVANSNMAGWLT